MTSKTFQSSALPSLLLALGFAAFAAGCSCSGGVEAGKGDLGDKCKTAKDCTGDLVCSPEGICTMSCGPVGCPDGFYCGGTNTCTRDCGPGDAGTCPGSAICAANGMCITPNDGGDLDVDCPDITVDTDPVVPTVVLLIDQSGSMTENFGGVSRWNAVRTALSDDTNGVVTNLDGQVIFGASLYTGHDNGTCPQLKSVAAALNNAAAIKTLLTNNNPEDDTPTAEAVAAVTAAFPSADGPKVLVLATDGDPDTCEDPDSNGQQGPRTGSENAVQAAYAAGIKVFVLSVGSDATLSHLQRLARLGQGQDPATGAATPYIANNPAALSAAFEDIIGGVRTCDFTLDGLVNEEDASKGNVTLDGTPLEYGTDWSLENGNQVHLLGAACDTFLAADHAVLSATFPCGIVVQ